ncbi:MAG: hypothetical protein L0Z50_35515 [Verrucomicrobiales bacterium]|nr:hypothetical protein [Verrucomicrobiales bacterium]
MKIESRLPQTWMLFARALVLSLSLVPVTAADSNFTDANWSSMNPSIPGANTVVSAAAVDGSGNLYIGGSFTVVGDVLANRIAKWDGSRWTALGSGIGGPSSINNHRVPRISALAVSGNDLYAAGWFTTAGGSPANYIAKWDGSAWTAFGSGMNAEVFALALFGSDLYVGGGFTMAGANVSPHIARAYLPDLPVLSVLRSGADVTVSWPSMDTGGFTLEQAAALTSSASWVASPATVTDKGVKKSATVPAVNGAQFFRLRRP